ncbi:phosphoheptose isomerase [Verrucomicrobia bacterium LW23]|nr:phosphoheptose isomerase [Verrucomicrobia bacterium LW23]
MGESNFSSYASQLAQVLESFDWTQVEPLYDVLLRCWERGDQIFICGNGGSGASANHLANDFLCGTGLHYKNGIRVHSLCSNTSVMMCLANDVGYEHMFSYQLRTLARPGDVLIVFSGSGNSPNIVEVLKVAKEIGVTSAAVLGFTGGKSKALADIPLHFAVNDMQIAEDVQMVVGHMVVRQLRRAGCPAGVVAE